MNKNFIKAAAIAALFSLAACGQHNSAPSEGLNLNSTRIYGEGREAEPAQLNNEHADSRPSTEDLKRMNDILNKLYPVK